MEGSRPSLGKELWLMLHRVLFPVCTCLLVVMRGVLAPRQEVLDRLGEFDPHDDQGVQDLRGKRARVCEENAHLLS